MAGVVRFRVATGRAARRRRRWASAGDAGPALTICGTTRNHSGGMCAARGRSWFRGRFGREPSGGNLPLLVPGLVRLGHPGCCGILPLLVLNRIRARVQHSVAGSFGAVNGPSLDRAGVRMIRAGRARPAPGLGLLGVGFGDRVLKVGHGAADGLGHPVQRDRPGRDDLARLLVDLFVQPHEFLLDQTQLFQLRRVPADRVRGDADPGPDCFAGHPDPPVFIRPPAPEFLAQGQGGESLLAEPVVAQHADGPAHDLFGAGRPVPVRLDLGPERGVFLRERLNPPVGDRELDLTAGAFGGWFYRG